MAAPWNARTSSLGYYAACLERARLDHGLQAGHLDPADYGFTERDGDRTSSPPADLGSVMHWHAQCAARCDFKADKVWNDMAYQGWDADRATLAKPSPAQFDNGFSMFRDETAAKEVVDAVSEQVVRRLPPGKDWLAEACFQIDGVLNGHIDFLSSDLEDIVDLKTTGSKPAGGRVKPAHFWQLIGYALGVMRASGELPKRAYVIYAHNRGDWCFRTKPIDLRSAAVRRCIVQLLRRVVLYADYRRLAEVACPSFAGCDDFCPYGHFCRGEMIPAGVNVTERRIDPVASSNPFAVS